MRGFYFSYSWAGSQDVGANLGRVEVLLDESVYDGRQLGRDEKVAGRLEPRDDASQRCTKLLYKLHNLGLRLVAGDPGVYVGDDVRAEGAAQLVPRLGQTQADVSTQVRINRTFISAFLQTDPM